jgi:hypothetical protein
VWGGGGGGGGVGVALRRLKLNNIVNKNVYWWVTAVQLLVVMWVEWFWTIVGSLWIWWNLRSENRRKHWFICHSNLLNNPQIHTTALSSEQTDIKTKQPATSFLFRKARPKIPFTHFKTSLVTVMLVLWVRITIRARCTTLCDKVCQWLATGRWFSPVPPLSSTNNTDLHDIAVTL